MTESEKLTAIAKVIKHRFPNLPINEVLDMAEKIMRAIND